MNKIKLYLLVTSFVTLNSMEPEEEQRAIKIREEIIKREVDAYCARLDQFLCLFSCVSGAYNAHNALNAYSDVKSSNIKFVTIVPMIIVEAIGLKLLNNIALHNSNKAKQLKHDNATLLARLQRHQEELGHGKQE